MVAGFNTQVPSIARVYDYLLGGKDNFAVDREMAQKLLAIHPPLAEMVKANRAFVASAVTWAASQGIDQFIDLGAGMPTAPNTHQGALAVHPSARVVYVDNDPVVVSHLEALAAKPNPGVVVIDGDVWQPKAILDNPLLTGHVDLGRPVCMIMAALLHFTDALCARELVRDYSARLAPGSILVITIGRGDGDVGDRTVKVYNSQGPSGLRNHSAAQFADFFTGLDIVPPGLGQAQEHRPGWHEMPTSPQRAGQILTGIARVPA